MDIQIKRRIGQALLLVLSVFAIGTTGFYLLLDGLSFIDALYLTIITLTTVGYGDITPHNNMPSDGNPYVIDLVAMCVNDIMVQGATPLFFLDYISMGKLDLNTAQEIVKGIAAGCLEANCSLIGGETAEMPGFYPEGEYDLAGFVVGLADNEELLDGSEIDPLCPSTFLSGNGGGRLISTFIEGVSYMTGGKEI